MRGVIRCSNGRRHFLRGKKTDPHHRLFHASVRSMFVANTCDGALLGEGTEGGAIRGAASGRWRRNLYRGALQVFREGIRRYPKSARLLYGASLATQVGYLLSWFFLLRIDRMVDWWIDYRALPDSRRKQPRVKEGHFHGNQTGKTRWKTLEQG